MDDDDRSALDLAADLLVFAPVGLALTAKDVVPELARRGREELLRQVPAARLVGQLAVRQGQREAEQVAERARRQVEALSRLWWRGAEDGPAPVVDEGVPHVPEPTFAEHAATDDVPTADMLPIPEYDSLSASQVLPRLHALTADELDAVRRYEAAHRARRTILGRIAQLAG